MFGRNVSDKRWVTTKLGDITEVISGATPKTSEESYWNGDIYWATPKDLSDLNGPYIDTTSRTLSVKGIQSCPTSLLPVHSVLLSSRAPIGYVAINKVPMATNQGFKSFVPDRACIDSRFLYEYLRQYRPRLEALGSGATFKEVSKRVVEKIEISLPPLQLQEQFGNVLDAVETMRIKLSEALVDLDTLFASLQQRAFRGEL
ncbi:MAG: restriction endonuclease subunit S [bacterium]|nr:restriction endonuclease subunit S [bacterium]